MVKQLHRNSQKRIYLNGCVYFITTNTHRRFPYFAEPLLCELFIADLHLAQSLKKFILHGYVILPDHVHLLIEPASLANISAIMHNIKRNFSHNANVMMGVIHLEDMPLHIEGDDNYRRLRKNSPPYYQQLPNWNVLEKLRRDFLVKYPHPILEFPMFKWQKSFHDHIIRSDKDYLRHVQYIRNNPFKHGIIRQGETYPWTWSWDIIEPQKNIEYN